MTNLNAPQNEAQTRTRSALCVLLTLTAVMLAALFSQTAPHPPLEVTPFALGPFLGASMAIGFGALMTLRDEPTWGAVLAALFAVTALVSFGPQKYFDPAFSRIWPAVITAQIAAIVIFAQSYQALKARAV